MKIGFIQLNSYLHAYCIPGLHSFLERYEDFFMLTYQRGIEKAQENSSANVILDIDSKISKKLNDILQKIAYKYYNIIPTLSTFGGFGVYVQDNKDNVSVFHNHIHQTSMTATLYLNPIIDKNGGGELEFFRLPLSDEKTILIPEKDWVYFFPSWVYHRPLPQISKRPRICLNWGIETENRIIHKLTRDKW